MQTKPTLKEKFLYWLDNKFLEGTKSMVLVLLFCTVIMILICGVVVAIGTETSIGVGIWKSITHIFDGGTIGGDEEKPILYMVPMFIITIFGIVVFSTLIGIINNALESKLISLEAGNYKVLEKDHIIILGFDSEIYSLLNELIIANEENYYSSKGGGTIVILDSYLSPQEMCEAVDSRILDKKNTKIIYRKGIIYNTDYIEKCSANTAKNIIVNVENDSVVLKCVLAANLVLEKSNNKTTKIVASMKEKDNEMAAKNAVRDRLILLDYNNMIAKMIAQSSRYQGVSKLFEEIFNFDGSEFYIEPVPKLLIGKTLVESALYYEHAIVVGRYTKDGKTYTIPVSSKGQIIEEGDKLIFLAEDDSTIKCSNIASEYSIISNNIPYTNSLVAPLNVIIFRYSNKLEAILDELYLISNHTNVTVVVEASVYKDIHVSAHIELIAKRFANMNLNFIFIDAFGMNKLEEIIEDIKPDSVIVLSNKTGVVETMTDEIDMHVQCEREDAKIMFILLLLRRIADTKRYTFTIASELHYNENQKLARDTGVNDFIVGSSIKNMICAQIADDTSRLDLLLDIVTSSGTEISFCYADEVLEIEKEYKNVDIKMYFAEQNKVYIGYKKYESACNENTVCVNPASNESVVFEKDDIIITLV